MFYKTNMHNSLRRLAKAIIDGLARRKRPEKSLISFIVDGDPAAEAFLRQKQTMAERLGIDCKTHRFFSEAVTESAMVHAVSSAAPMPFIGGMVVEWPLPAHMNAANVIACIPPEKDVDCMRPDAYVGYYPSVRTLFDLLSFPNVRNLHGAHVVIIGRGNRIGAPIYRYCETNDRALGYKSLSLLSARALLEKGCGKKKLEYADIIVLGTPIRDILAPFSLKKSAHVIDFNRRGMGPILVANLLKNFYRLNGV